jgi:hypothetical protein
MNGVGQDQEETTDQRNKENGEGSDPKVPGFSKLFRLPAAGIAMESEHK